MDPTSQSASEVSIVPPSQKSQVNSQLCENVVPSTPTQVSGLLKSHIASSSTSNTLPNIPFTSHPTSLIFNPSPNNILNLSSPSQTRAHNTSPNNLTDPLESVNGDHVLNSVVSMSNSVISDIKEISVANKEFNLVHIDELAINKNGSESTDKSFLGI